eukprot:tig00000789_g4132.t1
MGRGRGGGRGGHGRRGRGRSASRGGRGGGRGGKRGGASKRRRESEEGIRSQRARPEQREKPVAAEESASEREDIVDADEEEEEAAPYRNLVRLLGVGERRQVADEEDEDDNGGSAAESESSDETDASGEEVAVDEEGAAESDGGESIDGDEEEEEDDNDADAQDDSDSETEQDGLPDFYKAHCSRVLTEAEAKALRTEKRPMEILPPLPGVNMQLTSDAEAPSISETLEGFGIKTRVAERWKAVHHPANAPHGLQAALLANLSSYKDVFFAGRDSSHARHTVDTLALHVVNHVMKAKDIILRHNRKIKLAQAKKQEAPDFRDQGFTRPRVLVLLPFKNSAYAFVHAILRLLPEGEKQAVGHRARFEDEFGPDDATVDDKKPADWKQLFDGNVDDCFKIGISFSRKSVKLFADFYNCDVIIASPLGLRLVTLSPGEKGRDFDFLSSIEILLLDQADVFLMQNWEHVQVVLDCVNNLPTQPRTTDFSRVFSWWLDAMGSLYRQTLIFSCHVTPELNSLFNRFAQSHSGRVRFKPAFKAGSIAGVVPAVRQVFHRLESTTVATAPDAHFDHFTKLVLPKLMRAGTSGICVFVSSYFDFVRLRNHMKEHFEDEFVTCSEYTSNKAISRARTEFYHGKKRLLVVTERFHFFKRYRIRGIKQLFFYTLPVYAKFYTEFVNMLDARIR